MVRSDAAAISLTLIAILATPALAGDIAVSVTGLSSRTGDIGCALFSTSAGFPLDLAKAVVTWTPAQKGGSCRFEGVKAGVYAIAVALSPDGAHRIETDWLGRPKDAWGVSNNVRPAMRAPRFEEASIRVPDQGVVSVSVRISP
jgi:uncharacterized protein (DUF2141 family)